MTTQAPSTSVPTPSRRPAASSYRPLIRRLGQGVYQIGSRTIPGALYTTTLTGRDSHTCTCPAFAHGRTCWHTAAARQASAFFAKWYGQAVPAMNPAALATSPAPVAPFHETAAYKAMHECFGGVA